MACDTYVICFVLYLPKNGITVNNDGLLIARQHKHKNLIKPIQELSFYVWAEDEILLNEGNDLNCEGGGGNFFAVDCKWFIVCSFVLYFY